MNKQININEESYKTFQAALILTGENEEVVISKLIKEYAHGVFARVLGKTKLSEPKVDEKVNKVTVTEREQKALFMNWFRSLTRNGRPYNPVTISGYTGRIENACCDSAFADIPVKNLFSITDLAEFIDIQKQIKECDGYFEFDAKSHNGFTAALRKYEEFLRFQTSGNTVPFSSMPTRLYCSPTNIHRWTLEEDMICCKRFLEYYVINKSNMDTMKFLKMVSNEVPEIPEGSLRMKMQNIKYLSMQAGFEDTFPLKYLSQCSMQNKRAFEQALKELEIR